jgi:hypothetical protein
MQHSFAENHCVLLEEAKILETEKNPVHRMYKEAAYKILSTDPESKCLPFGTL